MDMPDPEDFDRAVDQFQPEVFDTLRRFNTFVAECALAANRTLCNDAASLVKTTKFLSGIDNAAETLKLYVTALVTAILQGERHGNPGVGQRQLQRITTTVGMQIDGWYDQLPELTEAMSF